MPAGSELHWHDQVYRISFEKTCGVKDFNKAKSQAECERNENVQPLRNALFDKILTPPPPL